MHNKPETLGCIIKAAREHAGITIEALAEKANITYRIENEGKKPSFDVLHKLVRELNIHLSFSRINDDIHTKSESMYLCSWRH